MTETELKDFLDKKLCEIAEALKGYYNPCQLKESTCIAGNPNPCCTTATVSGHGVCPNLGLDGCKDIHANCKLWLCMTAVKNTDPECVKAIQFLEKFAAVYGLARHPFTGSPHYVGADKPPK